MTIKEIAIGELDARLASGAETAVFDVRERGEFFDAHLLNSSSVPIGVLELEAAVLAPEPSVPVVLVDRDGAGPARAAARRLLELGRPDVSVLAGGLAALKASGRQLFEGVGARSKAFGELVAERLGTPMIPAEDLHARLRAGEDAILLDVRPFSEHRVMTVPGSLCAPGANVLAAAVEALACRRAAGGRGERGREEPGRGDRVPVVVHCAGRTRSIIAAQTLVEAGLPAMALENGTMGWQLAGFGTERGAGRLAPAPSPESLAEARAMAEAARVRHGVRRISLAGLKAMIAGAEGARAAGARGAEAARTLYVFDVRHPEEFAGTRPAEPLGETNAPAGQLVQATDRYVGVFGARVALVGDDGIRAEIAAGWLRRLGWRDVFVVDHADLSFVPVSEAPSGDAARADAARAAPSCPPDPDRPAPLTIRPFEARTLVEGGVASAVDFRPSRDYCCGRVPGSVWLPRAATWGEPPVLPLTWKHV